MSVQIRRLVAEDKPQWTKLWIKYLDFYQSTGNNTSIARTQEQTDLTFSRLIDPNEPMAGFVAETPDKKLVGFGNVLWHRNTWAPDDSLYLNDLYVDEDQRCGGVGRALFEQGVYAFADNNDQGLKFSKVYWRTQEFNHRAQLLYVKVGAKDGFVTYMRKK